MAVRYRDFEAPTLIDTTLLENGDSEAAASLARAFKQFEGIAVEPAARLRSQLGEREGAAAGASGNPEFRSGASSLTAHGQAYNNAALRSYAIRAEVDAEDQAARLEAEAANDPAAFAEKFNAVRDATIKNAPPEARAALSTIYTRRGGEASARLIAAQANERHAQARSDLSEGVARTVDRIAYLQASDDPAKLVEAEEEQVKLTLLIDGAHNDRTLTTTERQALHVQTQRSIVANTVVARFRKELDNPYGSPVSFIEKLRKQNRTSEALPPDEEEKLVDSLLSELREKNALESAAMSAAARAAQLRYEEGDREATDKLLSGQLTVGYLRTAVAAQRLDPTVARTLLNELQSGDTAADDPKVAFDARTNLLNYSEDELRTMKGLTWKTRGELLLKRREEAEGWKGTQTAREAQDRIDRALGIVPGTMMAALSPEEKRQRNDALTQWYDEVNKLDPAERQANVIPLAENVIGRFIRKNKAQEAQDLRAAKQRFLEKSGPPENMGEEQRKKYNERIQRIDADIAAAEMEAARK